MKVELDLEKDQWRILRVMNNADGHLDFYEFSRLVDLTPDETLKQILELKTTGHLKVKSHGPFGLSGRVC